MSIYFNSNWTKNQFFKDIDENNYFQIWYLFSVKKMKINFNKKENIITFVGKLNRAKGYDIFGNAIVKILDKYDWKA